MGAYSGSDFIAPGSRVAEQEEQSVRSKQR